MKKQIPVYKKKAHRYQRLILVSSVWPIKLIFVDGNIEITNIITAYMILSFTSKEPGQKCFITIITTLKTNLHKK